MGLLSLLFGNQHRQRVLSAARPTGSNVVVRSHPCYLQRRRWKQVPDGWSGRLETPIGSYPGKIIWRKNIWYFRIKQFPTNTLMAHPLRSCISILNGGWAEVHIAPYKSTKLASAEDVLRYAECFMTECLGRR